MSQETCPWCHTDIIWDKEIGREEECPHCFNELDDYRSIKIKGNSEELVKGANPFTLAESDVNQEEIDEDIEQLIDEIEDPPELLIQYELNVEAFRSTQEETLECIQCHEGMIFTGQQQIVDEKGYNSVIPDGLSKPFLPTPYTVHVHICPSCFEIRKILSQDDRMKLMDS
jgi:hypothetical protein